MCVCVWLCVCFVVLVLPWQQQQQQLPLFLFLLPTLCCFQFPVLLSVLTFCYFALLRRRLQQQLFLLLLLLLLLFLFCHNERTACCCCRSACHSFSYWNYSLSSLFLRCTALLLLLRSAARASCSRVFYVFNQGVSVSVCVSEYVGCL